MVTHVAMDKIRTTLTEIRELRTKSAPYAIATEGAGEPAPAVANTTEAAADLPPVDAKILEKAVQDLARDVQNLQRALEFSVDRSSGRTVIKVIDKETHRVIRQIPEKEVLALASRIEKAVGLLLHDEA